MKIKCTKCGNEKMVRKEIFEQRVQKAGSKEALLKGYLCRDCRPKAHKIPSPEKFAANVKAIIAVPKKVKVARKASKPVRGPDGKFIKKA